jgi:hypothetical protein
MSTDVASSRRILLGQYLVSVIDSCTSFETPEQELIFKFLGVADHLLVHDLSVTEEEESSGQGQGRGGEWGGGVGSERGIVTITTTPTAGERASGEVQIQSLGVESQNHPTLPESPSSTLIKINRWNAAAPYAAVLLSACMIVINFMGRIIKR